MLRVEHPFTPRTPIWRSAPYVLGFTFFATSAAAAESGSDAPTVEQPPNVGVAPAGPTTLATERPGDPAAQAATTAAPQAAPSFRPQFAGTEAGASTPLGAQTEAPNSRFLLRAFVGPGFSSYEDRYTAETHMFSEAGLALSVGYVAVQGAAGALTIGADVLAFQTGEDSVAARAAGNLFGGGIVLSTKLQKVEIGLGGYALSRAPETRAMRLTESRLGGGIGAFFTREWELGRRFALGATLRVLMLPTRTTVEGDGEKHVHFRDAIALVGVSSSFR